MRFRLLLSAFALFACPGIVSAWNTPVVNSPATGSNGWVGQTFDWNAVSASAAYQIEIDTLAGFNSPVTQRITKAYINSSSGNTDTQHNFSNLFFGKTYYWRVRAYIAGDTSAWSASWTFITRNYVTANSPASASLQWTGVTLDWLTHTGVSFYDMQCDTSLTFASPALRTSTDAYVNSSSGNTDTDEYLNHLYFGKTYHWRIRARNSVDTTTWSTPWTFNTADYVTLVNPNNAASVWTGTTVDWAAHTGVGFYDLQCDTSLTFASPALRTSTDAYVNSSSGNTDTDEYLNHLYFGATYYWRVRARNNVDTSSWSAPRNFITYNTVSIVSPVSMASVWTGVTLDWSAHTGVGFYDMQCDTSLTFASPALRTSTDAYVNSSSGNTDTDEYLNNLYFGTTYYWRVRARNNVDTSNWSTMGSFITYNYVVPVSPANASTQWAGVVFDWNSHTGVAFYDLQCDTSLSFASPAFRTTTDAYISSSNGNTDTDEYLTNLYFGTQYYWRVRARNTIDTSAWSAVWTFNTSNYVNLNTPANGQLNVNPAGVTLDWFSHGGIGFYQVQWDSINLYNSPVFMQGTRTYINSSSGNSDTQYGTGALAVNRVYFWRVRAWNSVDTSEWTERWFSTGTAVPTIPSVPTLIAPANMAVSQPLSVNLSWSASSNATSYEYQYALNPSFTSAVNGTSVTTNAAPAGFAQSTLYYWRVRAVNGNVVSAWSTIWRFTTTGPLSVPTLISPADLSTGISTSGITLDWSSVVNATDYEYEYSPDPTFVTGVISGTSGASFIVTASLPSQTTFYWRIRATDGVVYSSWSAVWSFTTEMVLAAPSLISPADLSTSIPVGGTTLTWNSVPNALTYEYEYSESPSFSNVVSGICTDTDTITAALNPYTTYYWHIRAINGSVYSPWSVTWQFDTEEFPAVPTLVSPADLSTGVMNLAVLLDWQDVINAVSYEYEYSTSPTFSSNVVSGTSATSDYTTPALSPLTTYYWHVRAVNGVYVSPWSQTWSFTTDNSTAVDENQMSAILVYPNPAATFVIISGVVPSDMVVIRDITGKIVKTIDVQFNGPLVVDVADLTPAMYTVEIVGDRNSSVRFVITE